MANLSFEQLTKLVKYDPETGDFSWIRRTPDMLSEWGIKIGNADGWNTRYLGSPVGTILANGYVHTRVLGRSYKLHRLAWIMSHGEWPDEVDHINGVRSDNRLINLRNVSRLENMKNKRPYKANSSGVTGISWHKTTQKWIAKIRVNRKDYHIGIFDEIADAALARKQFEATFGFHKNHGD